MRAGSWSSARSPVTAPAPSLAGVPGAEGGDKDRDGASGRGRREAGERGGEWYVARGVAFRAAPASHRGGMSAGASVRWPRSRPGPGYSGGGIRAGKRAGKPGLRSGLGPGDAGHEGHASSGVPPERPVGGRGQVGPSRRGAAEAGPEQGPCEASDEAGAPLVGTELSCGAAGATR